MADRKKVLSGLEHCSEDGCKGCPYEQDCTMCDGFSVLAKDALELLKEREHTKPYRPEELWLCQKCDQTIGWEDVLGIEDTRYDYCPKCGRIVDWDDER